MNEILNSRHLSQMNPTQKDEKTDEIQMKPQLDEKDGN
jgi:hypothetical protein